MKRKARLQRMQSREHGMEDMGLAITKLVPGILRIAPHWTPEQAFAVYETLDDLIDVIWRQYGLDIQQQFKNDRTSTARNFRPADIDEGDVPF